MPSPFRMYWMSVVGQGFEKDNKIGVMIKVSTHMKRDVMLCGISISCECAHGSQSDTTVIAATFLKDLKQAQVSLDLVSRT